MLKWYIYVFAVDKDGNETERKNATIWATQEDFDKVATIKAKTVFSDRKYVHFGFGLRNH